jgi:hypothetical protein
MEIVHLQQLAMWSQPGADADADQNKNDDEVYHE